MSSSKKMSALSKLSRKELISMNIELKAENNSIKEEICLLKTELNEYKNVSKKCQSKKRQKSSGSEALDRQTVNKKSFSDRICDDLCEEILQYLSLEDKLKLEGVSKQFQRTVLKKHYKLTIETRNWIRNRRVRKQYKYLHIQNIFIELKSLEVLLKKCPNITSIELKKADYIEKCDYNEVFRLITKYCDNLREINFWENEINKKNIEEFQRKFGPKIKFLCRLKDANNYNLFPNIEKINFDDYYDKRLQVVIPRLKLNKLKKIDLSLSKGKELLVKECVDTFPTITHFMLSTINQDKNTISKSLEFISSLENLIDIRFKSFSNTKQFCDSLKRMAKKCQKLKTIECLVGMTGDSGIRQLLSSIKAFPALKRFYLRLFGKLDTNLYKNIFSIEAFKGLSNITHLTLYLVISVEGIEYFKDIDINLPNIQYLIIENSIKLNREEVTQMADMLSRLSRLHTFKIRIISKLNKNEIEEIFFEKCKRLRTLDITY